MLSKNHMGKTKFGKLQMKFPEGVSSGSGKREVWICDCGKEKIIEIRSVISGKTVNCGRCNEISVKEMGIRKFRKLRMKDPKAILPGSNKKVTWICDCGREIFVKIVDVVRNHIISCGRCNEISAEEMKTRKFGKLRIKDPRPILPGSAKKVTWICDCGRETLATPNGVTYGYISSCGNCFSVIYEWYLKNKKTLYFLKYPIKPSDFPSGGPILLDNIINSHDPFKCKCRLCGEVYYPRFNGIKSNKGGLTCGCTNFKVSSSQKEISSFIESLGITTELEHKVNGLKYDIFVPSANLLIEYNGLRWHSFPNSKMRDLKKCNNSFDYSYLMIFEDEWLYNQEKVKNLLRNKLYTIKPISLRPQKCEIKQISKIEANPFYDQFHYIGHCNAKVHYGVFFREKLIAAMSFSHPTRQHIKHPFELIRMASDSTYRVHGIWSKLLKRFIEEFKPSSIVSFSDNRLFSGGVYGKIGFKLDGEIRPDYYWVKGRRRFHKSGLRKQKHEMASGLTETVLREAQGYRKIWDLGKKRWIILFS